MSTTKLVLSQWLDRMYNDPDITHMLVVCDTFDYEDYPVYIKRGDSPYDYKPGSMQRVMECYSRNYDKFKQLQEFRANHYD